MNPHYTYLLIDVLTVLFPFLLSFDKKVAFYKQWKNLWVGLLGTGALFIAWDVWFTAMGVWSFNDTYITGIKLAGLPIEEWAFFLVVPYSCVFIYECLLCYFPFRQKKDWGWNVILWLGIAVLAVGFMNSYRAYTFSAFSLCGFAMILLYVMRNRFPTFNAAAFVVCYIISLLPFLIVNGFLTALPVVMYDDAENLGIRIYTIPFEDCFYGMLLMLGNVWGMEWMRGRRAKTA
ncbi:MAG: lycopene cyclase domain-containing protein [Flavipsychrobacter sp.]|nr:lycopene cyclase domain-containing protein [Flavipsychrobacter sp.]